MITPNKSTSRWLIAIDTNQYAGNFERPMTAFCTGQIGECEVGEEYATLYSQEESAYFEDALDQRSDDHGCCRPTSCWPSPDGKGNNSVAIFFTQEPHGDQIEIIKRRAVKFIEANKKDDFPKKGLQVLGFRLIEERTEFVESPL